jgi:hypothetical protein
MIAFLSRTSTPLITGLFLVSLISGVLLFFHVGPSGVHGMHEVLSLVLIVPFVLHLGKNWRPFVAYLRRPAMAGALALSALAALAFMIPTGQGAGAGRTGGPDRAAVTGLVQHLAAATPETVATLYATTPEQVIAALAGRGLTVALGAPLAASGAEPMALVAALAALGTR